MTTEILFLFFIDSLLWVLQFWLFMDMTNLAFYGYAKFGLLFLNIKPILGCQ